MNEGVFHGFTAVAELKLRLLNAVEREGDESSTASPPWPN